MLAAFALLIVPIAIWVNLRELRKKARGEAYRFVGVTPLAIFAALACGETWYLVANGGTGSGDLSFALEIVYLGLLGWFVHDVNEKPRRQHAVK